MNVDEDEGRKIRK